MRVLNVDGAKWFALLSASVIGAVTTFAACASESKLPQPTSAYAVRDTCPDISAPALYFPDEIVPNANADDTLVRGTLAKALAAAHLDSLSCGKGDAAYRMLRLPSVGKGVIGEIVLADSDHARARVFELDNPVRREVAVAAQSEQILSGDQVMRLQQALTDAGIWTMPVWRNSSTYDGALWAVELRSQSKYRIVVRPTPTDRQFDNATRAFFSVIGRPYPTEPHSW